MMNAGKAVLDTGTAWCHHARMKFFKYHGTGNDFLVVDARDGRPAGLTPESVRAICDRHFGVGADGILLVENGVKAEWFMRVLNSDGSEAEMCGNGVRCVARFIAEKLVPDSVADEIAVETKAGIRICRLRRDADGLVASVAVSMGAPIFDAARIPMVGDGPGTDRFVTAADRSFHGTGVGMGNPHFVIFEYLDVDKAAFYGATLTCDPLFPACANIEFAGRLDETHFRLTVFERGCGITMACGTGASATIAAAVSKGLAPAEKPVRVDLPGGPLHITVAADMSDIILDGPAAEVFEGEVAPASFA